MTALPFSLILVPLSLLLSAFATAYFYYLKVPGLLRLKVAWRPPRWHSHAGQQIWGRITCENKSTYDAGVGLLLLSSFSAQLGAVQ